MNTTLSDQIADLPAMNKPELLSIWAKNFSQAPPPSLRKDLMVPILAYRIQALADLKFPSVGASNDLVELNVKLREDCHYDGDQHPCRVARRVSALHVAERGQLWHR
jgi:hypothetical protein